MKPSSKLYIRVAVSIGIGAVIVAFISSFLSYFSSLENVKARNYSILSQLAAAVEKTASSAAYVNDQVLAQEIVDGLSENTIISSVQLNAVDGLTVTGGNHNALSTGIMVIELNHPFIDDYPIGVLSIDPNSAYIQKQAQSEALQQSFLLIVHSILIALLVSFLVHQQLTKRLQRLTEEFLNVDPARPETMTLSGSQSSDEIGVLARGINVLMEQIRAYINNEKAMREKTEALERKFRLIFERASAGICLVNNDNIVITSNPAFNAMLLDGTLPELIALPGLFEKSHDVAYFLDQIRNDISLKNFSIDLNRKSGKEAKANRLHCIFSVVKDERKLSRSNSIYPNSTALIEVIMYDVTERAEQERKTRYEADHDALTHLKNRRSGERKIEESLHKALNYADHMVLMMVDLDKFKPVNDDFGHDAGDEVLVEVGKRISTLFGEKKDVCVRWGGDEFVITRSSAQFNESEVKQLGQKLLDRIRQPIVLSGGHLCQISASIGIVIAPLHGTRMSDLLANADITMYRVKELGRDRYEIFDSELDQQSIIKT